MHSRELRKGPTTTEEYWSRKAKSEVSVRTKWRQGYVNKVAEVLNQGMIPVNNGDILHR